jgi:DNA-binding transcriptional regulator LsrR (DeoR family)
MPVNSPSSRSETGFRQVVAGEHDLSARDVIVECVRAFEEEFAKNPVGPTTTAIAKRVKCSRNAVKAHLQEARRLGLLRLTVTLPTDDDACRALKRKFGLAGAVVSTASATWTDQASVRSVLASEAIRYLERLSLLGAKTRGDNAPFVIGLDGGQTLHQAVQEPGPFNFARLRYTLVPLVLGPLGNFQFTANIVTHVLASRLKSQNTSVSVVEPFTVQPDWQRGDGTRRSVHVIVDTDRRQLPTAYDVLLVGIGSDKAGSVHQEMSERPLLSSFDKHYGDILNLAFDRDGRELAGIAQTRATLFNLSTLREYAKSPSSIVVGVAGGKDKLAAIRTVLERRYISALITDSTTAAALIRH